VNKVDAAQVNELNYRAEIMKVNAKVKKGNVKVKFSVMHT
jgi:hypothetical protein